MPTLKGPLLIVAVICASFFLGYKQDVLISGIESSWESWRTSRDSTVSSSIPSRPTTDEAGGTSSQISPAPAVSSSPYPPSPYPVGKGSSSSPTPPQKNPKRESLDSIAPGSVQPKQEQQRNLYFEKLSEQLRELRGESPPSSPPPPAPSPTSSSIAAPPTETMDTGVVDVDVDGGSAEEEQDETLAEEQENESSPEEIIQNE